MDVLKFLLTMGDTPEQVHEFCKSRGLVGGHRGMFFGCPVIHALFVEFDLIGARLSIYGPGPMDGELVVTAAEGNRTYPLLPPAAVLEFTRQWDAGEYQDLWSEELAEVGLVNIFDWYRHDRTKRKANVSASKTP